MEAKAQAAARELSLDLVAAIFGEETFWIKKISVSCLRAWGRFTIITNHSGKSESQSQSDANTRQDRVNVN